MTSPDHPGLLPSVLLAEGPDDRGARRRSPRDWFVDGLMFVLALGVGWVFFLIEFGRDPMPEGLVLLDLIGGHLACLALWWRRRWPVQLSLAVLPFGTFSALITVAGQILLFTVALHRRTRTTLVMAGAAVLSGLGYTLIRPDHDIPFWASILINVLAVAATVAWGMFTRARRQLVLSLRERAVRAESEQQLRVEQARQLERTRIAREMHDVIAHRISLVSVHAGALEYHSDVAPEEVARSAGVIRANAHEALQDLRTILGVLRAGAVADEAVADPDRPQPTLADLGRLVEESRQAGMKVTFRPLPEQPAPAPADVGRTAYRVVQEALTNARKHAPGTEVTVALSGAVGDGLSVEVTNPWPVGQDLAAVIPGGGLGLAGLGERASVAGGRLDHGRTPDGGFRVRAWLPWPA